MEYSYQDPPEKHNGQKWFGHEVKLFVSSLRMDDLKAKLEELAGPKGTGYRTKPTYPDNLFFTSDLIIRFQDKKTAMLFKLIWEPCKRTNGAEDLYQQIKQMMKMYPTSTFGNFSAVRPGGAAILPLGNTTPTIHPTAKPLHVYQAKSRCGRSSSTPVIFDFESDFFTRREWEQEPIKHNRSRKDCQRRGEKVMTTDELMKRLNNGTES